MGMGVRSTLYHVRICDFAEYLNLSEIFFFEGVTIRKSLLMGQHVNHSIVHESCASKDKDLNRKDLACNLCAFDVKTDAE